jgi:hypothetical protein
MQMMLSQPPVTHSLTPPPPLQLTARAQHPSRAPYHLPPPPPVRVSFRNTGGALNETAKRQQ